VILYLLRHTKVNCPTGLCYGQTDVDLADTQKQEFAVIHSALQNVEFDAIYSSPLKRCSKLAETFENEKVKVQYDKRLMELNFGLWEKKYWDDIEKTAEAKPWFDNYVDVSCPGGESYANLTQRIADFLNDLPKNNSYQKVLIVCHGGPMRAMYTTIKKLKPQDGFEMKVDYGQLIEIELYE
jgi:alpha-ribazole phosphatase